MEVATVNNRYDFLDQVKKGLDADRSARDDVSPEEAKAAVDRYPAATPKSYSKISPEEFFDGAL